jgi:predicted phage tail protein
MSAKLNVVILSGENPEVFELFASNIKEVVSLLRLQKGDSFADELLNNNYKFVLADSTREDSFVALVPEVVFSSFEGFDTLLIVPEVDGELPAAAVGWAAGALMTASASAGAAGGVMASVAAFMATYATAITMVLNLALSIGLNMLMSALSPTPEFSSDPAAAQNKSNLFNGAPIVRNQGGSVPLIFGNPYCGAVLISSGAFTEEVTA